MIPLFLRRPRFHMGHPPFPTLLSPPSFPHPPSSTLPSAFLHIKHAAVYPTQPCADLVARYSNSENTACHDQADKFICTRQSRQSRQSAQLAAARRLFL